MTGPRRGGLLRANVSVGLGTALSRATGLLRWMALAAALGQASLSDAFNLANNSPNAVTIRRRRNWRKKRGRRSMN